MWGVAIIQAIAHPEMAKKRKFGSPQENIKRYIDIYTNIDVPQMTDDFLESLKDLKGISNCGGNLCLHLVGNLNAFVVAEIGNSGYIRHRELEFAQKDVPKAALISQIENTILIVDSTLENLCNEYPIVVFKEKMNTAYFLMHLATHLAYHLGQVNYRRRLLGQ